MIEVIYLDPARDEMIEAARWYDDQQRGVAVPVFGRMAEQTFIFRRGS